jgi:hypothetical protein
VALPNLLQRGSRGCGIFVHQNHASGGENSSIMVGMFVCLCFASKKPSKWEFFVPARTDLGVTKLLNNPFIQGTYLHPHILSTHKLKFFSATVQSSSIEQQHLSTSAAAA